MTTALFTHPACEQHVAPGHPEQPARLRSVMNRLEDSGLLTELRCQEATEAPLTALTRVHPTRLVDSLVASEPANGSIQIDPDTYMSPGSLRAARLAAGACLTATEQILSGEIDRAFCAVRPPGHHAEIASAMGFCLFNNVALAASLALDHPQIQRVAIVDFDVHHCNGTVDIFKDHPDVLVCSSFQENYYPHRYLDFSNSHIVNTPLAAGTASSDFRRSIERDWLPALEQHQPDLIFVSAGFDAHRLDPLAGLSLEADDYQWVTKLLTAVARDQCSGRLMSTLEGGYHLDALADSAEAHVAALL